MFSNCLNAVYFNECNVIEIFIIEVNMSVVSNYTRVVKFIINIILVSKSNCVFGNVKVELRTTESFSSNFNFSLGSNPNNDGSITPSDTALST